MNEYMNAKTFVTDMLAAGLEHMLEYYVRNDGQFSRIYSRSEGLVFDCLSHNLALVRMEALNIGHYILYPEKINKDLIQ